MESKNNIRHMKYKKVLKPVPFCDVCNNELLGNGSDLMPYTCSCGTWTFRWNKSGGYEYYIMEEELLKTGNASQYTSGTPRKGSTLKDEVGMLYGVKFIEERPCCHCSCELPACCVYQKAK